MKVRSAAVLAAAAVALAAPAAARAATITASGTCFVSSRKIAITGAGFTAGSQVRIGGGVFGSALADGAGNISTTVSAPAVSTIAPKRVAITASDGTNSGGATVSIIRDVLVTNAPLSGRPRQKTTWHFAGFPSGTAIYGHFRWHGRTIKNYRFGRPTGPCGTLSVRARRIPVPASSLHSGTWTLQLDQRHQYSRSGARRVITFRLFRTLL